MNSVKPLPRIRDFSQFHRDFFLTGQAVVLEGAAKAMPAFSKWTNEYLLEVLEGEKPKLKRKDGSFVRMPFEAFLQYLEYPERFELSQGPVYMTDYFVVPSYGETQREQLARDLICPLPLREEFVQWMTIYAGPPNSSTPMHQDVFQTHTWLAELRGHKSWRLCAPKTLDEDTGGDFDAFADHSGEVEVFETVLNPGDVIFLPSKWWHQVKNADDSTLAISGNFCSREMADAVIADLKARPNHPKSAAWLELFLAITEECRSIEPVPA